MGETFFTSNPFTIIYCPTTRKIRKEVGILPIAKRDFAIRHLNITRHLVLADLQYYLPAG